MRRLQDVVCLQNAWSGYIRGVILWRAFNERGEDEHQYWDRCVALVTLMQNQFSHCAHRIQDEITGLEQSIAADVLSSDIRNRTRT